jgi:hypothetical protein
VSAVGTLVTLFSGPAVCGREVRSWCGSWPPQRLQARFGVRLDGRIAAIYVRLNSDPAGGDERRPRDALGSIGSLLLAGLAAVSGVIAAALIASAIPIAGINRLTAPSILATEI